MGFPAHDALGVSQGMANIKYGDCVEDDFERVCSMFVGSARETMQAFRAFEDLEPLESGFALPLFDGVLAATMRARWIDLFYGADLSS